MLLVVGGPSDLGNMFLAHEDQKKLELFEMHTCLGSGTQVLCRYK